MYDVNSIYDLSERIDNLQLDLTEACKIVRELREAVQLGKGVVECDRLLNESKNFLERF